MVKCESDGRRESESYDGERKWKCLDSNVVVIYIIDVMFVLNIKFDILEIKLDLRLYNKFSRIKSDY